MTQELLDQLVDPIRAVEARFEAGGPWQEWADSVLSGETTTSGKAMEAAWSAGALMVTEPAPQQRIARAANAVADAAAMVAIHGEHAAPVVQWAIETVERELRDA